MTKTHWQKAKNYHTRELFLSDGFVIFKDYWDPGKNPNVTRLSYDDFLAGKFNSEILMAFNGAVVSEVIESIKTIQKNENH